MTMFSFMSKTHEKMKGALLAAALVALLPMAAPAQAAGGYQIYVSNEKSGDVTVIDGASLKAGCDVSCRQAAARHPCEPGRQDGLRRPERHADRRPPELDAQGNPGLQAGQEG